LLSYSEGPDGVASIPTVNRTSNIQNKKLEGFCDTEHHRNLSSRAR